MAGMDDYQRLEKIGEGMCPMKTKQRVTPRLADLVYFQEHTGLFTRPSRRVLDALSL